MTNKNQLNNIRDIKTDIKNSNAIINTFIPNVFIESFSPEVMFTAFWLIQQFGPLLNIDQYAKLVGISRARVTQQISDEVVDVVPIKVGRNNFFPTIEVAKFLHAT